MNLGSPTTKLNWLHLLILLNINLLCTEFFVTLKRNLSNENITHLRKSLQNEMWDEVFSNDDCTTDRYKIFRDIFHYHLNIACPLTKRKLYLNRKNCWVTNGIRKSAETLKQFRLDDEMYTRRNKEFKKFFLMYKRVYRNVIRAAKKIYSNAQINN